MCRLRHILVEACFQKARKCFSQILIQIANHSNCPAIVTQSTKLPRFTDAFNVPQFFNMRNVSSPSKHKSSDAKFEMLQMSVCAFPKTYAKFILRSVFNLFPLFGLKMLAQILNMGFYLSKNIERSELSRLKGI